MIYVSCFFLCLRITASNRSDRGINRYIEKIVQPELSISTEHGVFNNNSLTDIKRTSTPLLKCINTSFNNIFGTYVEGFRMNILLMGVDMVNYVEDLSNIPKFINTAETYIKTTKSSFNSRIEFNNGIKIRIADPMGPIEFNEVQFNNLTYKYDSSSGILIYNQKFKNNFTVSFFGCTMKEDSESYQYKGRRGGFLCQLEGNNETKFYNCSFSGCSSKEQGGCIYINSSVTIQSCTFKDCFSKDGSIIYISQNSNDIHFSDCVVNDIREGNSIITVNTDKIAKLEIYNFTFKNNSFQSSGIYGIKAKYANEIIFLNCAIYSSVSHSYIIETDTKIVLMATIIECYNKNNVPMLVTKSKTHFENLTITGNTTLFEITEPTFTMKNCTFHDIYSDNYIFNILSKESVIIEGCCFIDIEAICNYGGAGLKIDQCKNVSFSNSNFTRVGTSLGEGGVFKFTLELIIFSCISCRFVRCYAKVESCCFLLNDVATSTRETEAYYYYNYFEECYLLPDNQNGLRYVCTIRFNSPSSKTNIEICGCTFINPDIVKDKNSRMCCYQIKAAKLKICNNTYINGSNSLTSFRPHKASGEESNEYFLYENDTFINCSSYDHLVWATEFISFEFRNMFFKDFVNTNGSGCGITILKSTKLVLTNCSFINFTCAGKGAAFFTNGDKDFVKFKDCLFDMCKSASCGALFLKGTDCFLENVTFRNCISDIGACVFCSNVINLNVNNCVFENNFAEISGGVFLFGKEIVKLKLNNITANNNGAAVSGSIAQFEFPHGVIDVNFYDGKNNFSPNGDFYFVGNNSQEFIIENAENKSLLISSVHKFTIKEGNGSIIADGVGTLSIENFGAKKIEASNIENFVLNQSEINKGEIKIYSTTSVEFIGSDIIDSPEILLHSSEIKIKKCHLEYQKSESSMVQLRVTKISSVVIVSNSTFITNRNYLVGVDHIYATASISLFIDNECCFNKEKDKSIKLAHGSYLEVDERIFGCHEIKPETEDIDISEITQKPRYNFSGLLLILLSIAILVILVAIYCFISSKRIKELSDDQMPSDIEEESYQYENDSFSLPSLLNSMLVPTLELNNLSENEILTNSLEE